MTLSEFKAWFEGFTEDLDSAPNPKQWDRIKARVGEITGQPISYPVYVDRYLRPNPLYPMPPYWGYGQVIGTGGAGAYGQAGGYANAQAQNTCNFASAQPNQVNSPAFDSHAAMNSLGRTEAKGFY